MSARKDQSKEDKTGFVPEKLAGVHHPPPARQKWRPSLDQESVSFVVVVYHVTIVASGRNLDLMYSALQGVSFI